MTAPDAAEVLDVLRGVVHTLDVHGHIDSGTALHERARAALTAALAQPEDDDADGIRARTMLDCVRWIDALYFKATDETSKDAYREAAGVIIEQLGEPAPNPAPAADAVERVILAQRAVWVQYGDGEQMHAQLEREMALAAIAALPPMDSAKDGWRTMDSAPRDGTHILAQLDANLPPTTVHWFGPADLPGLRAGGWYLSVQQNEGPRVHPTAWQPLPAAPNGGGK